MEIDILGILDRYNLLEGAVYCDNNIKICCPFHNESFPSLSVNLSNGLFYCFGCESKGDLTKFVSKMENINTLKASIIIRKYRSQKKKIKIKQKSNKELIGGAYLQYSSLPQINWNKVNNKDENEVRKYMVEERGFLPEILKIFKVKIESSIEYPILIPIFENNIYKGNLRRRIDDVEENKYKNSKGFKKKTTLGGFYRKGKVVLVVEGYFDMMKAYQFGWKDVVCLFGCIPSKEQIEKLKEKTDTIITALDNTPLGRKGNKILAKHFKNIKSFKFQNTLKDIGDIKSQYVFNKCKYHTLKGKRNNVEKKKRKS